jgi:hypothetical protein
VVAGSNPAGVTREKLIRNGELFLWGWVSGEMGKGSKLDWGRGLGQFHYIVAMKVIGSIDLETYRLNQEYIIVQQFVNDQTRSDIIFIR